MPNVNVENLERVLTQLNRSDEGRQAMRDLLDFLEDGAISLDVNNQRHIACLFLGAWGSFWGTTLEALRCMVRPEPEDEPGPAEVAAT